MMLDQKPFQPVQQATTDVVHALGKTSQAVADSVITMQNHHLRFAQNIFLSWMELLTHQTESIQHLQQQWEPPIQKQQEVFQRLTPPSMRISMDLLLAPLTLSRKLVEASLTAAQREREPVETFMTAAQREREPVS